MRSQNAWREAQALKARRKARRLAVTVTFPSHPIAVRTAVARVLASLTPMDLPGDAAMELELVLCEIVNNVVEHAYGPERDGNITLAARPGDRGLDCRITDEGRPMPDGAAPVGRNRPARPNPAELPEGGFGWHLITELARDIRYTRSDGKNRLDFRMPLSR